MNDEFASLSYVSLGAGVTFRRPPEPARIVHIDDPAVDVMTDFNVVNPITVSPDTAIDQALEKMKVTGVRLLIVTSETHQIVGVITSKDIQGEKPIDLVQKTRGKRSEIRVDQIMTPQSEIVALNLGSLSNAQVGHIVETLRRLERQHILVVDMDPDTRMQRVCGMFSTTQIGKQLGRDVSKIGAPAHSLAEMVHERG